MSETGPVPNNAHVGDFLREVIDQFMQFLDVPERASEAHEGRVRYEDRVRFMLAGLVGEVLAAGCPVFDGDTDSINQGIPDLLDQALSVIPVDAEFIAEVMSRLPGQEMADTDWLGERTLAGRAKASFNAALYITLDWEGPEF